ADVVDAISVIKCLNNIQTVQLQVWHAELFEVIELPRLAYPKPVARPAHRAKFGSGFQLQLYVARRQAYAEHICNLNHSPRDRLLVRQDDAHLVEVSLPYGSHLIENSARVELLNFALDAAELGSEPIRY
ncbi:hypothetical protein, partial [Pseudomonas syringae]|uniref:hypothetical protein n=1 Tax=Pseudomonas syringae TaxID=317 RepID=UPI00164AFA14